MPLASKATSLHKDQIHPLDDQSSPPVTFVEKRRERRYATNDLVEISVLKRGGPRLKGTIVDVSRSGVRIEVHTAIAQSAQVEIIVPNRAVIFGETRYCRRSPDHYHVGVAIDHVYYSQSVSGRHISAERLRAYVDGKGLTAPDAIHVRAHLIICQACRNRLAEMPSSLAALTLSIFEWRPDMVRCWKQILKYWRTADAFMLEEVDVTHRRVLVDGPTLELLADNGTVAQTFGPGQSYDCWAVELRTTVAVDAR